MHNSVAQLGVALTIVWWQVCLLPRWR